jgi:ketosteroid isomerase-like protein
MKPDIKIILSILSLTVILTACESNKEKAGPSTIINEEAAIKSTMIDMWDAIEKQDLTRYANHVHPNFTQFGETDSVLLEGKSAEVNAIKSWMEHSSGVHTEMIEPKITIQDNVAWVVYYWSDAGLTHGKPFTSKGKSTRIFVKENDQWLCIHGHYTLLP